jgi:hypothetical protein
VIIPRFNAYPRAAGKVRQALASRESEQQKRQREFDRLVGCIIVIAEEGRPVTIDELVSRYAFSATFLLSKKGDAAERVASLRPDLAEAVGHMGRVS